MAKLGNFLILSFLFLYRTALYAAANPFEDNGFTLIGNLSADTSSRGILGDVGVKSVDLYVSGPSETFNGPLDSACIQATQMEAIRTCSLYGGKLLYILSHEQYEDVRVATAVHGIGDIYWTAGMFDLYINRFAWFSPSVPVNTDFIRRTEPACGRPEGGLSILGAMSTFGLCSTNPQTRLRFICRF